jgi:copper chaperone CopZ
LNPGFRIRNPIAMTQTLHVTGMTCGGCENAVKRAVAKLAGVTSVEASHAAQKVTVDYDEAQTNREAIAARINGLGYRVAEA